MGDGVFVGIKSDEVAIDFVPAGELRFIVGLEGRDVELAVSDDDGARVLCRNGKMLGDLA